MQDRRIDAGSGIGGMYAGWILVVTVPVILPEISNEEVSTLCEVVRQARQRRVHHDSTPLGEVLECGLEGAAPTLGGAVCAIRRRQNAVPQRGDRRRRRAVRSVG